MKNIVDEDFLNDAPTYCGNQSSPEVLILPMKWYTPSDSSYSIDLEESLGLDGDENNNW